MKEKNVFTKGQFVKITHEGSYIGRIGCVKSGPTQKDFYRVYMCPSEEDDFMIIEFKILGERLGLAYI